MPPRTRRCNGPSNLLFCVHWVPLDSPTARGGLLTEAGVKPGRARDSNARSQKTCLLPDVGPRDMGL
jgi:hypothetical protein